MNGIKLGSQVEKNNWKTASKKPVKNEELWKRLDLLCEQHEVNWKWVKVMQGIWVTSALTN